jgi:hypothetical protein
MNKKAVNGVVPAPKKGKGEMSAFFGCCLLTRELDTASC